MATHPTPAPLRVWQLPTFALGVAAVVGVVYARPHLKNDQAARFDKQIAALRTQVDRPSPDPAAAKPHADAVEASYELFPRRAAEARYLLGAYRLAVAEAAPSAPTAKDDWAAAKAHLEGCAPESLAEADRPRRQCRLARVWEELDAEPPGKVIEALQKHVAACDDPSEGFRRIAEAYLRLPTPDARQARDALVSHLGRALPKADAGVLARSRLQLAELHIRLNEHEAARSLLSRVTPQAPPEVFVAARVMVARSYLDEGNPSEAANLLEQARQTKGAPPLQAEAVLFHLGAAYHKQNKTAEAKAAWDEARAGSSPEARVAGLRLVELMLADGDRTHVPAIIDTALKGITKPDDWRNPHLSLDQTRAAVEGAAEALKVAGDFTGALKVARLYGRVADGQRHREAFARTAEAHADALLAAAEADPAQRDKLLAEAKVQAAAAAEEYAALSKQAPAGEKAELLRKAAAAYSRHGDAARGVALLDGLTKSADVPEDRRGDAYVAVGETHLAAGDKESARAAFAAALKTPGPSTPRARLALARLIVGVAKPTVAQIDEALALIEPNLDAEWAGDSSGREGTLFLVAELSYLKKDYQVAAERFGRALADFPRYRRATEARRMQARSYWSLAAGAAGAVKKAQDSGTASKADLDSSRRTYFEYLQKSLDPFKSVECDLLARQASGRIAPEEQLTLRNTSFAIGECLFFLGRYDDASRHYRDLAGRYKGTAEELVALSQIWQCQTYNGAEPADSARVAREVREAFGRVPADAFSNKTPTYTRKFWEEWLSRAESSVRAAGGTR